MFGHLWSTMVMYSHVWLWNVLNGYSWFCGGRNGILENRNFRKYREYGKKKDNME